MVHHPTKPLAVMPALTTAARAAISRRMIADKTGLSRGQARRQARNRCKQIGARANGRSSGS
jgi:hypothetical protein